MKRNEIAKAIAEYYNMPKADKYKAVHREFDDAWEIIGLVDDPNVKQEDVLKEKIAWPKAWVTVGVIPSKRRVPAGLKLN